MDTISKAKKLQAMYSYKTQFLYNLVFHLLLALTCIILCSYPCWFPSLCSSMKQLLFLSLPKKSSSSSFFSPTCLFIVVNVIVVFLVGESRLGGSNRSPAGEIYDEYVDRSRSFRRVSTVQEKAEEGKKMELTKLIEETVISIVNEDEEVKEEVKNVLELSKEEEHKEVEEKGKEADGGGGGGGEEEEEEEEESGLPVEELNRRVEEFIARVYKQRLLEAW